MRTPSWFDPRAGAVAALLMGGVIATINASHGFLPAAFSAGKQAVYTFFFGGLIVQLCTWLASRRGPQALAGAIAVPSVITIVLVYLVHSLRGTPEPVLSTAVVATIGVPSFAIWARRTRGEIEDAAETADP